MDSRNPPGVPFRYDIKEHSELPFWPFLIAPLQESQQTVVFGPSHVQATTLIDRAEWKGDVAANDGTFARIGWIQGRVCVAVTLVAPLPDEANRVGLSCTVGLLARPGASPREIGAYLHLVFRVLGGCVKADLLQGRATTLIAELYSISSRQQLSTSLYAAMEAILMIGEASATAGGFGQSRAAHVLRRWLGRLKRRPRLILYDPVARLSEVIEIIQGAGFGDASLQGGEYETRKESREDEVIIAPLPVAAQRTRIAVRQTNSGTHYIDCS